MTRARKNSGKAEQSVACADRLAMALRKNLHRRKEQARQRGAEVEKRTRASAEPEGEKNR